MANQTVSQTQGSNTNILVSYTVGFVLSAIFIFVAYALVHNHWLVGNSLYIGLSVLALLQLTVQSIFFLRLGSDVDRRWNTINYLFTLLIVLIVVSGSLWIMYNLNYNMTQTPYSDVFNNTNSTSAY